MAASETVLSTRFLMRLKSLDTRNYCRKINQRYTRGFPDAIVKLPANDVIFIEFKRKGGKLSVHQKSEIAKLAYAGSTVMIITFLEKEGVGYYYTVNSISPTGTAHSLKEEPVIFKGIKGFTYIYRPKLKYQLW